jgi:hypothetical protein
MRYATQTADGTNRIVSGRGKRGRPRSVEIDGVTEKGFGEVGLQSMDRERTTTVISKTSWRYSVGVADSGEVRSVTIRQENS